ncbi:1997_t:CDS:2 [Diversispora eburnea]|uniref:1997_t:CDS:1 n=1 Tax=Diversispora eburnea TaxID=1213867 RepID=A0A9N9AFQ1_9GLOM|nr:1997_t:CDS:2 [Diversispora eburnea]
MFNLSTQVRFIAEAVTCGDLNENITDDFKGEILDTANTMWMGYFELKI